MTESTGALTAAQAAARLGVKPATIYAYVSRGLLPRRSAPDGRTSLFDPADVARLARRSGARKGTPSDVIVASELTLIEGREGRLWFRGLDASQVARDRRFEEVASWLWTGAFDEQAPWRPSAKLQRAVERSSRALGARASHVTRIVAASAAIASAQEPANTTAAAREIVAGLVGAIEGSEAPSMRVAERVATKLTGARADGLVELLDATLAMTSESGLTHPALVARLCAGAGGTLAEAVAAAALADASHARSLARYEDAIAKSVTIGPRKAAEEIEATEPPSPMPRGPFKDRDPRVDALIAMLRDVNPERAQVVDDLAVALWDRGGRLSPWFAVAGITWGTDLPSGSAGALSLVGRSAGWIAHALEEYRQPTGYRPRLAYTGPPPRSSTPRRPLDAVRGYLDDL